MNISEKEKAALKHYLHNSSLFDAVEENNAEAVQLLLTIGIDANCVESDQKSDRERPIHSATYYGNAEVLKVLLDNNAKPELKNSDGLSAYQIAIDCDDPEINELLKQHKLKKAK